MAYTPTVWKNGEFPPIDAEHLNKIEQGIANSAPGGYGIGETPKYIADANDAVKNGRYAIDGSTLNLPGSNGDLWAYAYLDVYTGNRPDVYIKQTITSPYQYWHQCEVTRCFYSPRGGWQPWEWVNPPMILGTEYRTTERCLGKPVYCKLVNCGEITAGTNTIAHNIASVGQMVGCELIDVSGYVAGQPSTLFATANKSSIYIEATGSQYVGRKIYVRLRYTKSTD